MPFRRNRFKSRGFRTPIHSVKNQDQEAQSILASTNISQQIALGQEIGVPTKVLGNEVPVGSKIYSVDIIWNFVSSTGGITGVINWCLLFARTGQTIASTIVSPDWTDIGLSEGRNQVIESHGDIFGTEDAGPIRYKRHIRIPKIYQRLRAGDSLRIVTNSDQVGTLLTGFRYKYYS